MKNYGLASFLLGLVGVYATAWVIRKGWEQGGKTK